MALTNDDNVLQLYACEEDVQDQDCGSDGNYVNRESLLLKFFNKGAGKIEDYIRDIHNLLCDKSIKVKGFYLKGLNSLLIEVPLTDSFRNWLAVLIEVRNNVRSISDKVRSELLKNAFGKFSLVIKNELIFMNVIPNINEHVVECKSSFYPYGLCNGKFLNIMAKGIREDPDDVIKNIITKRDADNSLTKVYGIRLEFVAGSELSIRFLIKTEYVCDKMLKSLNAMFGALSFCASTIHLIPSTQEERFEDITASQLNAKDFWDALSYIDVLICNNNEQSMAMNRKNILKRKSETSHADERTTAPTTSVTSIFDRLGPKILVRRTFNDH
jgi:hypothetical protein